MRDQMHLQTFDNTNDVCTVKICITYDKEMLVLELMYSGCHSIKVYDHYSLKKTFHKLPMNCSQVPKTLLILRSLGSPS